MGADFPTAEAQFVVNLNRQGLTVLVVEHDMAFVRYIAQSVTV
jgi:ABC-type uncharacterized transport system ATPase subunit